MKLEHFYHVYATRAADKIVAEHLDALIKSGLADHLDRLHLGIVGNPKARQRIIERCYRTIPTEVVAEADEGWEQVTLTALWERRNSLRRPVLYAHTKGASDPTPWNSRWRRAMTAHLVTDWRTAVKRLSVADVVGCNWIDESTRNSMHSSGIDFFAGNFWWARADYLAKLAAPPNSTRWEAEVWIGTGLPRIFDVLPGFPSDVIR